MYVDAHCHVDLYPDHLRVMQEADDKRIYTLAVTNTPSVFQKMREIAQPYRYVRPALGLHPELAVERHRELPLIESLIRETRYIGEIGLDFRRGSVDSRSTQIRVFRRILDVCGNSGGRVLTIHSRGAEKEVLEQLVSGNAGLPIMHWFSGSVALLRKAIEIGCYFSVNSAMTNSESGIRVIRAIPDDRLLTESDGPFVRTGSLPATPSNMIPLIQRLAALRGADTETTRKLVLSNFRRMLEPFSE